MRAICAIAALGLLSGCVETEPKRPILEAPAILDINSEAFQKRLADEQAAALREASNSGKKVTQTFIVGWEMHNGLFLVPLNATSEQNWFLVDWVKPDFRDDALASKFEEQANVSTGSAHLGKRLVCLCTGVPWQFYSQKRFIVQSATLEWQ